MFDRRGNPVSSASGAALDHAEHALWQMMSFYGTPIDALDAAAAADPSWPLPHLMKAGFLLSLTEPGLVADAQAALAAADALLAHANQRERDHHAALQLLAAGDWHGACRDWEALLLRHPRDGLALQWAHLFDFYRGDAVNLRQRVARVLPQWDDDDPLQPYVLGMYAFGLEENQLYAQAEDAGRCALDGARVPWAIHAVAHVMEMQGRHEEGSAWMARWAPDWTEGNGFVGHLGFHEALFALERLDFAEALRSFDRHLAASPEQITLQRLDAAAVLWRLQLLGAQDLDARWQRLADGWPLDERGAGFSAFNDLHALLALLGRGDLAGAEAWVRASLLQAEAARGANHEMAHEVGAPLMRGMLAFARGRFDDAIEALYPARAKAQRFGGSHAQRDLIDQTLLAAAAGAGHPDHRAVGRALLNERRLSKPRTPLTEFWERQTGFPPAAPRLLP
jgi:hypothetical protein